MDTQGDVDADEDFAAIKRILERRRGVTLQDMPPEQRDSFMNDETYLRRTHRAVSNCYFKNVPYLVVSPKFAGFRQTYIQIRQSKSLTLLHIRHDGGNKPKPLKKPLAPMMTPSEKSAV
jgi:hypothetical protein